jgi:hypothetical protein
VSKGELCELYRLRRQVELDLRSIKTVMQMDVLRCKSPQMVEKEIAVHLAGYNLVRAVLAQAAYLGHVLPRQLSFKAALQLLCAPSRRICAIAHVGGLPRATLGCWPALHR